MFLFSFIPVFQHVFIPNNTPLYLDPLPTLPTADKLISKHILGVLRGKYNSVSLAAVSPCRERRAGAKVSEKLLFSQAGLKIWTCA